MFVCNELVPVIWVQVLNTDLILAHSALQAEMVLGS